MGRLALNRQVKLDPLGWEGRAQKNELENE